MVTQIKNKALERALKKAGIEDVGLFKDNSEGYFFVGGLTDETMDIMSYSEEDSIYVYSFNQQSIESWVEEIEEIWDNALEIYQRVLRNKKGNVTLHLGSGMTYIDYSEED